MKDNLYSFVINKLPYTYAGDFLAQKNKATSASMWKLQIIRGAGLRSCSIFCSWSGHLRGDKNVFLPIRATWVFSHLIQKVYLTLPIRCCVPTNLLARGELGKQVRCEEVLSGRLFPDTKSAIIPSRL